LGVGYARTDGTAGFLTGDTIFGGTNPVTPRGATLTQYSKPGNTLGHGFGGDVGVAVVSGPIEVGVGVNDIGATITWPDTRRHRARSAQADRVRLGRRAAVRRARARRRLLDAHQLALERARHHDGDVALDLLGRLSDAREVALDDLPRRPRGWVRERGGHL